MQNARSLLVALAMATAAIAPEPAIATDDPSRAGPPPVAAEVVDIETAFAKTVMYLAAISDRKVPTSAPALRSLAVNLLATTSPVAPRDGVRIHYSPFAQILVAVIGTADGRIEIGLLDIDALLEDVGLASVSVGTSRIERDFFVGPAATERLGRMLAEAPVERVAAILSRAAFDRVLAGRITDRLAAFAALVVTASQRPCGEATRGAIKANSPSGESSRPMFALARPGADGRHEYYFFDDENPERRIVALVDEKADCAIGGVRRLDPLRRRP